MGKDDIAPDAVPSVGRFPLVPGRESGAPGQPMDSAPAGAVGGSLDAGPLAARREGSAGVGPGARGSAPKEFESDKTELKKLIDRFASRPQDFQWPEHPILGFMSQAEWLRLGYLHLDHHLRQFGE